MFRLAVSPDGKLAAWAGCEVNDYSQCIDKPIFRMISVDEGRFLFDLPGVSRVVQQLAFSPDGTLLAAAGCDLPLYLVGQPDTICDEPRLWIMESATGDVITEIDRFQSQITSLVWSPQGDRLYTGVYYYAKYGFGDNEIRAWDPHTGENLATIQPQVTNCSEMYLDLSPDGRYLILDSHGGCGYPSFVEWWDIQDLEHPREVHKEQPAFDHNLYQGQLIARNDLDNTFKLFDLETGSTIRTYPHILPEYTIRRFDLIDSSRMLVFQPPYDLTVFDLQTGSFTGGFSGAGNMQIYRMTPDRRLVAISGFESSDNLVSDTFSFWDPGTGQEIALPTYTALDPAFCTPWQSFTADLQRFICVGWGGLQFTVWGFPVPEQSQAEAVLLDYLDQLARADYIQAASVLALVEDTPVAEAWLDVQYLKDRLPAWDGVDTAALLQLLCENPGFPCRPVLDVSYRAQLSENQFLFVLRFAGEGGEPASWPACEGVPAAQYCDRRDGRFAYLVERQTDGSFKVINALPPALELLGSP